MSSYTANIVISAPDWRPLDNTWTGLNSFQSNLRITAATAASSTGTGALQVSAGGVGINGAVYVGGGIIVQNTTESTSTDTGALQIQGGIGMKSNLIVGGNVVILSTIESSNTSTGALVVNGGVGISANLYVEGNAYILGSINSTSTNTGSLQVSGGVGIKANLIVGGNTYVSGNVGIRNTTTNTYLSVGPNGDCAGDGFIPGISMKSTAGQAMHYSVGQDNSHNVFLKWIYNATPNSGYGSISTYNGTNNIILNETGGNIGIGTTLPSCSLHVHKASAAADVRLSFTDSTTGSGGTTGFHIIKGSQEDAWIWNYQNNNMRFGTNNQERMQIKNDGTIYTTGIGGYGNVVIQDSSNSNMQLMIGARNDTKICSLISIEQGVTYRPLCLNPQNGSGGNVGIGTTVTSALLTVNGSVSKSGGSFDIKHPLLSCRNSGKRLVHSFIEGPRCDLIYRGTVNLINGIATIDIDKDSVNSPECAMTDGTFVALCVNPVKYLHNNDSFDRVRGDISGNILTIYCENITSNDSIDWMVIAERKDEFIKEWNRTNKNGELITEYIQEE